METTMVREIGGSEIDEVGAYLRERRIALGLDLNDVVDHLYIRRMHLQAIEDGRWDDLPGPTYATGFLRSYADLLGLDGDDFIGRLRDAGIQKPIQEQLTLPAPVEEKRLPTGLVMLVAAVICAAAYAGWYFVSSEGDDVANGVTVAPPEVAPQRTASNAGSEIEVADAGRTASQEAVPAEASPEPEKAPAPMETADAEPAPSSQSVAEETVGEEPRSETTVAKSEEEVIEEVAPLPPADDSSGSQIELASAQAEASREDASRDETVRASTPAVEETAASTAESSSPPIVGSSGSAVAAPAPARSGEETVGDDLDLSDEPGTEVERDAQPEETQQAALAPLVPAPGRKPRVILRANAPSWVLISSPTQRVVYTRTMQAGESYVLPEIRGMLLWTGNAGALEVTVGGKLIPPLGPSGAVIRDIPLDANLLLTR